MRRLGRLRRAALVLSASALSVAALGAGSAAAAFHHPALLESFGSDGKATSTVSSPGKLAFNQSTQRLYVVSNGENKVFGFSASGAKTHTPLGGNFPIAVEGASFYSGLAAEDAEGHVYYLGESPGLFGFDSSGNPLGGGFPVARSTFADPCGDAVDSAGNVWVGEYGSRKVTGFTSSGAPLGRSIDVSAAGSPFNIEFDRANDDLYVAGTNGLYRFDAADGYATAHLVDSESVQDMAFDASAGVLYVAHYGEIDAYNEDGGLVERFGRESEGFPAHAYTGVEVDEATGVVYVADIEGGGRIDVIPGVIVPNVTTGEPTGNTEVSGIVDPAGGGPVTSCKVNYGATTAYGETASCTPAPPYAGTQTIHAVLTGLQSENTYHYQVVAGNANGTNQGLDETITPHFVVALRTEPATAITRVCATLNAFYEGNGEDTHFHFEYGPDTGYGTLTPSEDAGSATGPQHPAKQVCGLTPGATYHYRVVAVNGKGTSIAQDRTFTAVTAVEGLTTEAATGVGPTTATMNASFQGNGEDTHYFFEWGTTTTYGHLTAAPPGEDLGPVTGKTALHFNLTGLTPITTYHYRVVATNAVGTTTGADVSFKTGTEAPVVREYTSEVHSDGAVLNAEILPGGLATTYQFEYGTSPCSGGGCTAIPATPQPVGAGNEYVLETATVQGLTPATTYYLRTVAINGEGTTAPEIVFSTFRTVPSLEDSCPNALARQQTGAALLLDCRAYELVSAASTGGYDVESDLVPGQRPYAGFPSASGAAEPDRVLYGVHQGGIPGAGDPTDTGVDPYVATRGADGWSTSYVGIPASDPYAAGPFSSEPTGIAAGLGTFAFGGPGSCAPCFEGGYSGIPVRLADGRLVQGMVPAPGVPAPGPSATPDGYVAQALSADGTHLIFASTSRFAPGGNAGTGDVSIYDRNLVTGETHTVSNSPSGAPLACLGGAGTCHRPGDANGIAELGVSADGSRILLGQKVSVDAAGNVLWHLYMDVGDSATSIDLTPGAADGAILDGMTADGSRVFFTTADALPGDGDTSADVYAANVSGGTATIERISTGTGGTGNTDACDPVANSAGAHWNSVGPTANCGAVAIPGGLAASAGSIYLLSPERLAGSAGTVDQPNLYLAVPGAAPRYVATLSPEDPAVIDSVHAAEVPNTTAFQVTPDGRFAAFPSGLALTGDGSAGAADVYRYAPDSGLSCASCSPTRSRTTTAAALATDGSSLSASGQVFFDTNAGLILRDSDRTKDVYEWEPAGMAGCGPGDPNYTAPTNACLGLISAGSSTFASSLLGVSADGTDAFFFTHDSPAAQDRNGPLVKIYDARVNGGFFDVPAPPPCAASDECHGAGSAAPGPPDVRTTTGSPGNVPAKKHPKKKHHKPKKHKKHGGHHKAGKGKNAKHRAQHGKKGGSR
jgi:hypothetical protein